MAGNVMQRWINFSWHLGFLVMTHARSEFSPLIDCPWGSAQSWSSRRADQNSIWQIRIISLIFRIFHTGWSSNYKLHSPSLFFDGLSGCLRCFPIYYWYVILEQNSSHSFLATPSGAIIMVRDKGVASVLSEVSKCKTPALGWQRCLKTGLYSLMCVSLILQALWGPFFPYNRHKQGKICLFK